MDYKAKKDEEEALFDLIENLIKNEDNFMNDIRILSSIKPFYNSLKKYIEEEIISES